MLMPKKNRIAIYELLFKEGVMVAKKDVHLAKHPELADKNVPNLHVMKAMQSLKSCGPDPRPQGRGPREWKERDLPDLTVERLTEMLTGDLLLPLVLTRKQRLVLGLLQSSTLEVVSDAAEDSSLSKCHFLYNKENLHTFPVCALLVFFALCDTN
uniref:Ribosomal protein S10 n=1 Tax=Oryzias melastigma TaxID=30732 RepID=A0A3B3BZB6_ORYME